MSLYGGIKLAGSKLPQASTSTPTAPSAAPSGLTSTSTSDQDSLKPKPSNWSAALRFAPTQRKKPTTAPAKPTLATAFSTALDDDDDDALAAPAPHAGAPRIAKAGKASLNVEPVRRPPPSKWGAGSSMAAQEAILLEAKAKAAAAAAAAGATATATTSSTSATRRSGAPTRIRRIIPIPPSMTLEDETILPTPSAAGTDVNGFAATAIGQKLAKEQERKNNKRGKKRKGQSGPGAFDDPALRYGEIPYDPARPCDYAGYKTHVKLARAQRRLEREEEERQRRRREGSEGSSYYSEDDDEDREGHRDEPAKRPRFFAPPTSYDDDGSTPSFPPPVPFDPTPSVAAPSREETADEAYARRVALSNPAPPNREETGDEAYQRRLAMSRQPPPSAPEPVAHRGIGGSATAVPVGRAPAPPSFITSSFVPPTTFVQPTVAPASLPASIPPPPPGFVPPPSFAPATQPFAPPPPPPAVPPPQPQSVPAAAEETPSAPLDAAAARAREIAARLSKLGGAFSAPAPPQPSTSATPSIPGSSTRTAEPVEPDNRPFAERMMSKYGWSSGKGLGANESGMTTALSVSRPSPTGPKLSRAQKKKHKHFGIPVEPPPTRVGMAGRNNVVDSSRGTRNEDQVKEMGGQPSRVVVLENLCGPIEVDDDLPGEIAEEANKLGVVERCAVVVVPFEDDEDEVRVFLVMSGLAGAYNAIKSFEGRFFGGRTVRARYYDEALFKEGQHHL
ncbi:uncharacterized protein JCM15063_001828 [Sporobolomyces koalae]|uniref:uncharacterized protein n=1 Tax=Sporobolomyces koalae TaxID=500713 RepID=UPI003175ADE2